jgi:GNAT superfamily N-acetyltransferase
MADAFAHMNKTRAQYERYFKENLKGARVTLVALLDEQIVGYTNVVWRPQYAPFRRQDIPEINDMNVVAGMRQRGIGAAMIEAAEAIARQQGKSVMGIGVGVTPDYAIAQRLYPKLGYVHDGRRVRDDEWGGTIFLTKQL